jgi:FkbM family methyltransferase
MNVHHAADSAITENALLGGRLHVHQPARGYRVAIDPVLLAAAVPIQAGETALDVGTGVGTVALCLAARVPGADIVGMERNQRLVELARENAALNLLGNVTFIEAAVGRGAPVPGNCFDHVVANPPYLEHGKVNLSPSLEKRAADVEEVDLEAWVDFCFSRLRPRGVLTVIHRADRVDSLITSLKRKGGEIMIFPLWPRAGASARRVIVRCRKGAKSPAKLLPGLALHQEGDKFTPEAEAVLRHGAALDFRS